MVYLAVVDFIYFRCMYEIFLDMSVRYFYIRECGGCYEAGL